MDGGKNSQTQRKKKKDKKRRHFVQYRVIGNEEETRVKIEDESDVAKMEKGGVVLRPSVVKKARKRKKRRERTVRAEVREEEKKQHKIRKHHKKRRVNSSEDQALDVERKRKKRRLKMRERRSSDQIKRRKEKGGVVLMPLAGEEVCKPKSCRDRTVTAIAEVEEIEKHKKEGQSHHRKRTMEMTSPEDVEQRRKRRRGVEVREGKIQSWHQIRNQDLLEDVLKHHSSEEEEEEEKGEEVGVLAELHKEFVTLAGKREKLRERCEGKL